MPTEESLESRDPQKTELISREADAFAGWFVELLETEYKRLASGLSENATTADFQHSMIAALAKAFGDAVNQADLANILGKANIQSAHVVRLLEDAQANPWDSLLDDTKPTDERGAALWICAESDQDRAAAFLADELARDDIPSEWQDALILCAETIQFHEDALRHRLWSRLLEIASHRRRDPDDTASKPIVFSAIRCMTSMIPVEELPQLLPLLEPPAPLETRLVTLQCVTNLFEAGPPTAPDQLVQLRDRIYELATKFLDRDWLIAGERAAIGLNAIQALACMGDDRLTTCVSQVLGLRMDWFARQLERKLEEIVDAWEAIDDCQALRLVREQISLLRETSASTS